ncbi:uncharacterized protein [Palaemon carinicauda]|uniref:uncharacterized protein n=1 Tax=Palaemon carinicauda TaxID=392227 RepID=UPI0035B65932
MTDLPSIMDKIRILRSSRRRTYPAKINNNETSVTMAPVKNSEVATSDKNPQWVPFLVLDISQPKDSPASEEEESPKDIPSKLGDSPEAQKIPSLTPPIQISTSAVPKSITTSMSSAAPKTVTTSMSSTVSKNVKTNMSSTVPKNITTSMSSTVSKNVKTNMSSTVPKNITTSMSSAASKNAKTNMSSTVPKNITTSMASAASNDVKTSMSSTVHKNITTSVSPAVSINDSTSTPSAVSKNGNTNISSAVSKNITTSMCPAVYKNGSTSMSSAVSKNDTTSMPSPVPKTVTTSMSATNDKTVIKTTTTKRSSPRKSRNVPVACTIMVTSKENKNSGKIKVKKLQDDSSDSPALSPSKNDSSAAQEITVSPVKTADSTGAVSKPEKSNKEDDLLSSKDANFNTTTLAPVGCVICSKYFPTLTEMQTHYLSEHKNRRGRENRKRPIDVLNSESQRMPNLVAVPEKIVPDESGFKFPLYTDENDPKCPVCSIAFKTAAEVKNHVKLVHSYRCSECNDTFYNLFEFTSHKCNKGIKKSKRNRKKLSRSSNVNEVVAKTMKSFVPIQPNLDKIQKSNDEGATENFIPPVQHKDSETSFVPMSSSSPAPGNLGNQRSELQVNTSMKLQITSVPQQPDLNAASVRTPSPELTIAPLENKLKPVKIRVLETKNLRCFKFKKDEVVTESPLSKTELIQEKIAQLKNNPNVSVSWVPKLRLKAEDDDEYVCGRCNVICDDMEDYMDHIQDCLTITSVTLEKVSTNPPLRILKLQKEISSFGFQETNNNRYSVNKNLMKKLQEVIPLTEEDVRESSPTPSRLSDLTNERHSDTLVPGSAGFCEYNSTFRIKEEPLDYEEPVESLQSKVLPNSKGSLPMVVIPVDQTSANKLITGSELSNPGKQAAKLPSPDSSSPSSPWDTSPYDLMIDTDDIKMEVEEEVIDDYEHF